MPDFFPFLPDSVKNIIPAALRPELSIQETAEQAREFLLQQGHRVSILSIRSAFRRVESQTRFSKELAEIITDRLVPRALHVEDHGYNLGAKYSYRVKGIGREAFTGRFTSHFFSIISDEQLTPQQIFDQVTEATSGFEGDYNIIIERYNLESAFINPSYT